MEMEKTIFFSYAHPDDEAFTVGGLLAKYADEPNVKTVVYSATLGDAGKCGNPPVCDKEKLAEVRQQELIKACNHLGVDHLHTDTYLDGKLDTLPKGELVQAVKNLLTRYKPEVVVTFPPDGISGHRDHIAISSATLEAAKDLSFIKRFYYIVLPSIHESYDVKIPINSTHLEKVRMALQAHKTQHLSVERVFPTIYDNHFNKHDNNEHFITVFEKIAKDNDDLL
jgi:N-acetylglucosamine malate deacetylase 2